MTILNDHTVTINFKDSEISTLYNFLEKHKEDYPDLYEKVYQDMTAELISRINKG